MKIMSVDYGDSRTGIAVSDIKGILASPICVIEEKNFKKCAELVCEKAKECNVGKIIVGFPRNMDGSIGPRALKTQRFADMIRDISELQVLLWDERNTTKSANNYLNATNTRGKKRKTVIDAVAAVIILQSYLDSKNNG